MDQHTVYKQISDILFLDIETVSLYPSYQEMPDRFKSIWDKKAKQFDKGQDPDIENLYFSKAGIFAEFGRVLVISMGMFYWDKEAQQIMFKLRTLQHESENELLNEFATILNTSNGKIKRFCAHNGKEFDYPYICRRLLINGLPIPQLLDLSGKKPWEIPHLDTLDMWRFGDYKNYTSLETLATVFDVETSKDDIDGSKVNDVYYNQNDTKRIAHYCEKDVVVTAQIFLKLKSLGTLNEHQIVYS